ncbi:tubulin epsilon and delta complex protein 2 isoform X1 [Cynocephalus volans]|uniref:tubulin epsilon and delta complex protein 2 isoform X1 n=1 Tax=Cynocephalus volans TaxID=110931 RepID=UPI002FC9EBD0
MLPPGCSRRLVAELQGALDACAQRQRQLEQSLRVSRRLLRAWEPARTPAPEPPPGPETNKEDPSSACPSSPQDLKELEFLTQALEKAARVRKSISKAGERVKASSLKSVSIAASLGTTVSAAPRAPGQAGSHASGTRPTKGIHQNTVPVKGYPEHRFLSARDRIHVGIGARATRPGPGLRDQQITPSAVPQAPEVFTLKEKGTLLQLPVAFRKAASQNFRLWDQLKSTHTNESTDAAAATAKTHFLQKMQTASCWPSSGLSAMEVEVEVGRLRNACSLLRLRMREELSAAPADWMQEYRCLLTLEGLQAMVGQCLHRLQELRAVVVEQPLVSCPMGRSPWGSLPCGGGVDPSWSPQPLIYSSTQELQTLAALRLRVAMLEQQIHLQKMTGKGILTLDLVLAAPCSASERTGHPYIGSEPVALVLSAPHSPDEPRAGPLHVNLC